MNLTLIALLTAAGLFFGILGCLEIGRRVGVARIAHNPEGLAKGGSAAEGAVFALLGLLIAFTFSGAASRFEDRRHLITEEANDIGTAYLRVDLLPSDAQPEIRELFRRYVDLRSTSFLTVKNNKDIKAKFAETQMLQGEIWTKSLVASRRPDAPASATMLLLPALNAMIDITTTRMTATQNHPPLIIFFLLTGLIFLSALLVGYDSADNKERNWLHPLVFAGIMSLTVYVIIDIEFPRLGLIRIDAADQVLVELRSSMD
ncbi:MAG: hypothetical protein NTW85_09200 [Methylococcales bacterium]|nr:hypothetical protein [Methylococcales bacterium]